MQGQATSAPSAFSQINIKFGQFTQNQNTPLNLTFSIEYCSSKIQNKRFNAAQYINKQIPLNSILIQVQAKQDGQQLAVKLNQIRKKSESMIKLQQENEVKFDIIGKGNKVYLLLQADRFQDLISIMNQYLVTDKLVQKEQKWLQIKLKSNNKFDRINQLIGKSGIIGSFLDSLLINVKFNKTQNIKELVKNLLNSSMGNLVSQSLITSVQHLNLDLQFESASTLQNFPDFKEHLNAIKMNHDFSAIKPLLGKKFQMFVFGKPFGLYLNLTAQDLSFALDLLLA